MTAPETFCRELCKAIKTILDSMVETDLHEQATDYAVLFSKSILVTTNITGNYLPDIKFVIYQTPNTTIEIDTLFGGIVGYINGCKVIELPLDEDLISYMQYVVDSYAEYLQGHQELQIVQRDSNSYTIDLRA